MYWIRSDHPNGPTLYRLDEGSYRGMFSASQPGKWGGAFAPTPRKAFTREAAEAEIERMFREGHVSQRGDRSFSLEPIESADPVGFGIDMEPSS